MRLVLVLAVLSLSPVPVATASDEACTEATLPFTEVRELHSEAVGQDFRILVARPLGPPTGEGGTYPVVYVLDGDIGFPLVRQTALSLQTGGELPPAIIVGIAYSGGIRAGMMNRDRDFTPTPDPVFMEHMGGGRLSGGAEPFLRFVRRELQPFIEAEYPANPDDATVIGISFGGLFATYTLLHHPDTFQRYVIGSPSLWWDDRVSLRYEEAYAEAHDDLPARVFVSAGGRETAEHDEAYFASLPEAQVKPMLAYMEASGTTPLMVEVVEPFVRTLGERGYPGLHLTYHLFPEETHNSAPPMIISRGLRVVFDTF